ncbi:MAG: glycosyltransferase [Anaerolineales bacterium]|uniref:Glycosyltransferase n=1 Tax=Candidatus Desulfolinea nitratireducens TaxID=2841698 RepID=A0A8J6TJ46_9CHLR|nr:glycosyltransferase [Candidatus Desulfolinea nitratireducens]MBL6960667.1 glycosyltransferase [Anaerolineales bacterium]
MALQKPLTLSVILPAYNEGDNIYANILRICKTLLDYEFELIVVDDGSEDNTSQEAGRAVDDGYPVQVIHQEMNRGKGATLFNGVAYSKGARIAFLDADLEIVPEYLLSLLKVMDDTGADVVAGVKDMSDNQFPWARRMMSRVYRDSVAFLFGLAITDTQTGIKLFKREVLEATVPRLRVSRFAFDIELLVAASRFGYRIVEVPVKIAYQRTGSLGRMNSRNIFGSFFDTLSIYWRASFWRWLEPSLVMQIWMLLFAVGVFLFGVGVGKLLTPVILQGPVKQIFRIIALQFLPTNLRDWLLLIGGFFLIMFASIQLNKKLLEALVRRDRGDDLAGIFRK